MNNIVLEISKNVFISERLMLPYSQIIRAFSENLNITVLVMVVSKLD